MQRAEGEAARRGQRCRGRGLGGQRKAGQQRGGEGGNSHRRGGDELTARQRPAGERSLRLQVHAAWILFKSGAGLTNPPEIAPRFPNGLLTIARFAEPEQRPSSSAEIGRAACRERVCP